MNRRKLNFLKAKNAYTVDEEIERELDNSLDLKDDENFGRWFFRTLGLAGILSLAISATIFGSLIYLYVYFNYIK